MPVVSLTILALYSLHWTGWAQYGWELRGKGLRLHCTVSPAATQNLAFFTAGDTSSKVYTMRPDAGQWRGRGTMERAT